MNSPNLITKSSSWKMFNDISQQYDFLNHLLSFGLDIYWRSRLAKFLPDIKGQRVLDLATGTADVLISLFKNSHYVASACGIDLADKMMEVGKRKITKAGLSGKIELHHGDAHHIPFSDNTFDAATIAFGIRNMDDPGQVLRDMRRVLKIKGRALILEFSLPGNAIVRAMHLFYLRHLVPLIGALFSGHYAAYKYLNKTIESFPYGQDFCDVMAAAGFIDIEAHPLLFGIATIYTGDKP